MREAREREPALFAWSLKLLCFLSSSMRRVVVTCMHMHTLKSRPTQTPGVRVHLLQRHTAYRIHAIIIDIMKRACAGISGTRRNSRVIAFLCVRVCVFLYLMNPLHRGVRFN